MNRWLALLLLAAPAALIARALNASPLLIFVLAALGIVPLAGLIGQSTEVLAEHLGQGIGGLLNATFGNAAEIIIGLTALAAGLPEVVQASLAGSIIGNVLLVLGTSMLIGGWRYRQPAVSTPHCWSVCSHACPGRDWHGDSLAPGYHWRKYSPWSCRSARR